MIIFAFPMVAGLFETINNIVSLVALAYLSLIVNGILKAPTRESRERFEALKHSDSARWVRIGVPVLFVTILLLFIFDRSV